MSYAHESARVMLSALTVSSVFFQKCRICIFPPFLCNLPYLTISSLTAVTLFDSMPKCLSIWYNFQYFNTYWQKMANACYP